MGLPHSHYWMWYMGLGIRLLCYETQRSAVHVWNETTWIADLCTLCTASWSVCSVCSLLTLACQLCYGSLRSIHCSLCVMCLHWSTAYDMPGSPHNVLHSNKYTGLPLRMWWIVLAEWLQWLVKLALMEYFPHIIVLLDFVGSSYSFASLLFTKK